MTADLAAAAHEEPLTPEALARAGTVDDLARWMREAIAGRVRCMRIRDQVTCRIMRAAMETEAREMHEVWIACRDEHDRRNGARA